MCVSIALHKCSYKKKKILEGPDSQTLNCSILQNVKERLETVKENINLLHVELN